MCLFPFFGSKNTKSAGRPEPGFRNRLILARAGLTRM